MNWRDPGNEMRSALHEACGTNSYRTAELLIQNSAGLSSRDYLKRTPLHLAVKMGAVECVAVLLKNGADPHSLDAQGKSPFMMAEGGEW